MTELIKIENREGLDNRLNRESVNARDLHLFLESKQDFSTWIKSRIEKYNFDIDTDYIRLHKKMEANNATKIDYYITIDMAKELSMVENNERGKEARRYFIEVEKRARQLSAPALTQNEDAVLKAAFQILDSRVKKLESKITEDAPKVQFFNEVTGSRDAVEMSKVAKLLTCGMGRTKLFNFLRDEKILRQNNEPYQKYIDNGWFRVIEQKYTTPDGSTHINIKTLVYQKGIDGISKLIAKSQEAL